MPKFKGYNALLTILRNKGFKINKTNEGSRVKRVLEKESYYNVVNGYKDLFLDAVATRAQGKDVIKSNTDFFEMKALYDFDREIRILFLKYILMIENNFKAALAHEFSKLYGCDYYLKLDNFDTKKSNDEATLKKIARENGLVYPKERYKAEKISEQQKISAVTKLFGDIQQEIARQMNKNNPMICHYMSKYGYMPLWVLVNALTLGKVTTFYFHMKDNDKVEIAKRFNISYKELHKYMSMLGIARNKCAHDERFFNLKFTQNIHTNSISYFKKIGVPTDSQNNYTMGINDVFAIAIIFKQMLTKSDFNEFVSSLKKQFDKLGSSLKTITLNDVQKEMGFINNWIIIKNL